MIIGTIVYLIRTKRQRNPQLSFLRKVEVGRHHPRHGIGIAVERERLAQHIFVSAEPTQPQSVTDERNPVLTGLLLFRTQKVAQGRLNPKDRKEVGRNKRTIKSFGLSSASEIESSRVVSCQVLEGLALLLPVTKICCRCVGFIVSPVN